MRRMAKSGALALSLFALGGAASPVLPPSSFLVRPQFPEVKMVDPEDLPPAEFLALVEKINAETRIPLWIVARLYQWESGWDPDCAPPPNPNGSRDYGLAQLNSRYIDSDFRWRYNDGQEVDPFDPETSLRVGMRHLAAMYRATGSWVGAVWSYNAGLTAYREATLPEKTMKQLRFVFREML